MKVLAGFVCLTIVLQIVAAAHAVAAEAALESSSGNWEFHTVSPPGVTLAMAQTTDGHIWFGTSSGLFRYNGLVMRQVSLGASDGPVRVLLASKAGGLWAATGGGYLDPPERKGGEFEVSLREGKGGLARVEGLNATTVIPADGARQSWVWSLCEDGDGHLWVGTEAGLRKCARDEPTCIATSASYDGIVSALLPEGDGGVWVGGAQGLSLFAEQRSTRSAVVYPIRALARQSAHELWALGDRVLTRLRDARVVGIATADAKTDLRSVLASAGDPLVGSTRGLMRLRGAELIAARAEVPKQSIRAILQDREGSLWLAVKGGGVLQGRKVAARNVGVKDGLPSDVALSILRARSGELFVNTNAGLALWSGAGVRALPIAPSAAPWERRLLAESLKGNVYLAWDDLIRLTGKDTEVFSFPTHGRVRALHIDEAGNVWLGWQNGGVSRFDEADLRSPAAQDFGSTDGLCTGPISHIVKAHVDSGTDLWFAGKGGVALWHAGTFSCVYPSAADAFGNVTGIAEQPKGTLWITTVGPTGLWMAHDRKLTPAPAVQPFPGTSLYGVLAQGDRHLWFTSARGVFRAERPDIERFLRGGPPARAYHADERSGMRSADGQVGFHENIVANGDGGVFVTTALGVIEVLAPETLPKPKVTAVIDAVLVNGISVPMQEAVILPANARNLEIRYSVPTFLALPRPQISHQLDGWDQSFTADADAQSARYAALPPGAYRFSLRATSIANPKADLEGASLGFEVAAAWHQKWMVRTFLAMVLAALLFAAHRFRTSRIHKHFAAIQTERSRIARELHDGLAQFFVGLGLQLEALRKWMKSSPEQADKLVVELKLMARDAQRDTKQVVWGLREGIEAQTVTAAIESAIESARQKLGIAVTSRYLGVVPQSRVLQTELPQITREALTNAVRHGKASATHVELAVHAEGLKLTIDDDGVGLAAAGFGPVEGGFGLVGIRESAARCGGVVAIESRAQGGTRLSVTVAKHLGATRSVEE